MPSASRVLQDHTVLQCRSLDRLYLNAYIPQLQRPESVKRFLERERTPIASPALFQARSDAFVKELHVYAEGHGAPWIVFERGERKEDHMKPLFAVAEARLLPGLVAVGVAQERTTGWKGTKRPLDRGGFTFGFSRVSLFVNAYYCYIWDAEWGPSFIKLSGYAPWGGRVYLNGHEWAKRQLARRGVGYVSLDNGFRAVDDPDLLNEVTASLGADEIRRYFARWMHELPQPLTAEDRDAGYGYALSMLQVEVSDTRVFDRPIRGRQWFEATIGEQLTLGRPETVALLFGRRSNRRTPGRFETRVVSAYTTPTITFRYKHSTVKQYRKGGPRSADRDDHQRCLRLRRRASDRPLAGAPGTGRRDQRPAPRARGQRRDREARRSYSSLTSSGRRWSRVDEWPPSDSGISGSWRSWRRW